MKHSNKFKIFYLERLEVLFLLFASLLNIKSGINALHPGNCPSIAWAWNGAARQQAEKANTNDYLYIYYFFKHNIYNCLHCLGKNDFPHTRAKKFTSRYFFSREYIYVSFFGRQPRQSLKTSSKVLRLLAYVPHNIAREAGHHPGNWPVNSGNYIDSIT